MTVWGESHGKAIGVLIDGCPANLFLHEVDFESELEKRKPGKKLTSSRKENDRVQILSGVFENKTTGTPISLWIENEDVDSSKYEEIKDLYRPSHANFTYLEKYGIYDYRGGGRASGRITACFVAAGVIAGKILQESRIDIEAYAAKSLGSVESGYSFKDMQTLQEDLKGKILPCPDLKAQEKMIKEVQSALEHKDSVGGVVEFAASCPSGLGDPIFDRLDANLAKAMLSIPGTKGFEMGEGFSSSKMNGSNYNDLFIAQNGKIKTSTNHSGGVLGGISSGMPLIGRVAFKPTPTIGKEQKTVDLFGNEKILHVESSRHDPCIAIRGVAVVKALCAFVLADAFLSKVCKTLEGG